MLEDNKEEEYPTPTAQKPLDEAANDEVERENSEHEARSMALCICCHPIPYQQENEYLMLIN